MPDIPADAEWGILVGRFGRIVSDSPDEARVPDVLPLSGTVTLTPSVSYFQLPSSGTYHVDTLVCPLVDGVMYPPGTEAAGEDVGVPLLATDQPNGVPTNIQWTATFQLEGVDKQPLPLIFNVPGGGAEVALAAQLGEEETPPYVTVVTTEDRELAQLAASDAAVALIAAQNAASAADAGRQSAELAQAQATAAQGGAETAQVAAETARLGAEVAQAAAEAAADGAGGGAVSSVNGQTGAVVLDSDDVGAAPASHTHTIANVASLQAALDAITKQQGAITANNAVTSPARTGVTATVTRTGRNCYLTVTVPTTASPAGTGAITAGTPVVLWGSAGNTPPTGYAPSVGTAIGSAVGSPTDATSGTSITGKVRLTFLNGLWSLIYYPLTSTSSNALTITATVVYPTAAEWPA